MTAGIAESGINKLISFEGSATALGGGGGSSLICATLTTKPDFNGQYVTITGGPLIGQTKIINGSTVGGTIIPDDVFGAQITIGTNFMITTFRVPLSIMTTYLMDTVDGVYVDSVHGQAGTAWPTGSPGVPSSNLTDALVIAAARKQDKIYLIDVPTGAGYTIPGDLSQGYTFIGDIEGGVIPIDINSKDTHNSVFRNCFISGIGVITDTIESHYCRVAVNLTTLTLFDCVLDEIAPVSLQVFEGQAWNDPTTIDCVNQTGPLFLNEVSGRIALINAAAQTNNIIGSGLEFDISDPSNITGTFNIYGDVKIIGKEAAIAAGVAVNDYTNKPNDEVAVSVAPAFGGGPLDILNLDGSANNQHFTVDKLRLKSTDPGLANDVIVRLWENVNGVLTMVDDAFTITSAGPNPFTGYYSLSDMFGLDHLAGDKLQVTVEQEVAGASTVTASYAVRSA